jgi:transposase
LRIFLSKDPSKIRKGVIMKNARNPLNSVKQNPFLSGLEILNPNSAGIDIGSREHWVCIAPHLIKNNIRKFSAFSCGLRAISKWLKKYQVDSVVMESTGVYWIPLYDVLDADGFKVELCNARDAKNTPGRQKTDAKDCAWLQKLYTFGLLKPSFIPSLEIRSIRVLMRYRERLIQENSRQILRMQKSLALMNVLLYKVVSEITGETGMNIIKAIIAGNTNPESLIQFKHPKIVASDSNFLKALDGTYRPVHIKTLSLEVEHYEYINRKIEELDQCINEKLVRLAGDNPETSKFIQSEFLTKKSKIQSDADLLYNLIGVDLTKVPGLNPLSIRKLISETGIDMSKWKDSRHFTSWLRLAPNNKISGGKILSNHTLQHKPNAARIFRMCASSLRNSNTFLGSFLRRKKAHKGYPKALTATARKIAVIYYTMLKYNVDYVELGVDHYRVDNSTKIIRNLHKAANKFGYILIEKKKGTD